MRAITLLYHDVVEPGNLDESGFPGPAAGRYKLNVDTFRQHLSELADTGMLPDVPVTDVVDPEGASTSQAHLFITFDDGGRSALTHVAESLIRLGWIGHFFITTERIGSPGFLRADEIRQLSRQGHVIGSHSHTHPTRMSALSRDEAVAEWRRSGAVLSRIIGHPIRTASIPGGYYSSEVARSSAAAGIEFLFTSEPTTRIRRVGGCWVLGRYALRRGDDPGVARDLVTDAGLVRLRQAVRWNASKPLKILGGTAYLRVRDRLLGQD